MSLSVHATASKGFQQSAGLYEKVRPEYPSDAIKFVTSLFGDDKVVTVVDLAAGTGKLTRDLVPYFHPPSKLIAIEPVAGMRQVFKEVIPGIDVLEGTADAIPLGDSSLDGIFIGQAFHWFANEASLLELWRVLKPAAPVIMLWNMEDKDSADWVKVIRIFCEKHDGDVPQYRKGQWRDVWDGKLAKEKFTPLEQRTWNWELQVPKSYVWDRVASKSYISVLNKEETGQLQKRVWDVISGLPGEIITYPHVTDAFWVFKI